MWKKSIVFLACYQALVFAETVSDCQSILPCSRHEVEGEFKGATAIEMNGKYAYVCNLIDASVSVINIKSNQVSKIIKHPSMVAPFSVSIMGGYAYISNLDAHSISIIDVNNNEFVTTFSDGIKASYRIATSTILDRNYAFLIDEGLVQILDLTYPIHPKVLQTIINPEINGFGIGFGDSPDHSIYLTATRKDQQGEVLVYSHVGGLYDEMPRKIFLPKMKHGRILSSIVVVNNAYAYIGDKLNDSVLVCDLQANHYLTTVGGCKGVANLTTDGENLYVCNIEPFPLYQEARAHSLKSASTINVIDTKQHKVRATIEGIGSPQAITLSKELPGVFYILKASHGIYPGVDGGVTQAIFSAKEVFASHGVF